jgi:hypothetical protein
MDVLGVVCSPGLDIEDFSENYISLAFPFYLQTLFHHDSVNGKDTLQRKTTTQNIEPFFLTIARMRCNEQ